MRTSNPIHDRVVDWEPQEVRMLRHMLEQDSMQFMRYFFRLREGNRMLCNWHHYLIAHMLEKTITGEVTRLMINIAPGYSKTEIAVINYIMRGLALNPRAKFIHASYSAELARENSSKIKNAISSVEFQELWPMTLRDDAKAKGKWYSEQGGGMLAAPAGGQITGFRAGRMEKGFSGAFILDDALKPDDATSAVKREAINNRFNNTMRSRLALDTVPMIIIMQRLHEDDLCGFLLRGGSDDKWDHLVIPTLFDDKTLHKKYNPEYTHGRQVDLSAALKEMHKKGCGPFSKAAVVQLPKKIKTNSTLWIAKHDIKQLDLIKRGDSLTFAGQYQQDPTPPGGLMFKDEYWRHYEELPSDIDILRIYADTAQKTGQHNDYSVFQLWGRSLSKGVFLVDQCRGKWEAPELESKLVEFWNKHKPTIYKPLGVQQVKVEDKSSGTGLIQSIQRDYPIPIVGIQRDRDKYARAYGVIKYFEAGKVWLPKDAPFLYDYKEEFRGFSALMNHRHDDQIDPTIDAVEDLLIFEAKMYSADALS